MSIIINEPLHQNTFLKVANEGFELQSNLFCSA